GERKQRLGSATGPLERFGEDELGTKPAFPPSRLRSRHLRSFDGFVVVAVSERHARPRNRQLDVFASFRELLEKLLRRLEPAPDGAHDREPRAERRPHRFEHARRTPTALERLLGLLELARPQQKLRL